MFLLKKYLGWSIIGKENNEIEILFVADEYKFREIMENHFFETWMFRVICPVIGTGGAL